MNVLRTLLSMPQNHGGLVHHSLFQTVVNQTFIYVKRYLRAYGESLHYMYLVCGMMEVCGDKGATPSSMQPAILVLPLSQYLRTLTVLRRTGN